MGKRRPKGDGWFIKNKDGTYTNKKVYKDADGVPHTKSFRAKTKTEATNNRLKWEHNNAIADHPEIIKSTPVVDYLWGWLDTYKKSSLSDSAYDNYSDCIKHRVEGYDIAHMQMNQLNTTILQKHLNQLVDEGYSLATIQKTSNILNACFKKAVVLHDIRENPMDGVEKPTERVVKTKAKDIQFYPKSDVNLIFKEADRRFSNGKRVYHYGMAIVLMIYTGMRWEEAAGLKWKCVNFNDNFIKIENVVTRSKNREPNAKNKIKYTDSIPKTDSSKRTIILSKRARYALEQLHEKDKGHTCSEDYVIQTQNHGERVSERNVSRALHSIEKAAGTSVQGAGLHVLRHTFASLLIYKDVDIVTVSKLMGHSKPSVTANIYVGIIEEQRTKAISKLDID